QLYSLIIQSPLGAEFFQAEIRLNVLLADMQKIINDGMKDILEF
ncbi:MAG: YlbF family regulator, partial [Clostridia bacterium]|nr:YlbF family regulator [Clostridia bacterium]